MGLKEIREKLNQPIGSGSKKSSKKAASHKSDMAVGEYPKINLMPASHLERKEKEEVKKSWKKIAPMVLASAIAIWGVSFGWAEYNSYQYDQKSETERESEENLQQYSEISDTLNEISRLENIVDDASSTSVDWQQLIQEINNGLPGSSRMTAFSVGSGVTEGTDSDGNSAGSSPIVVQASIVSLEPLDYSDIIYAIPGTSDTELGNLSTGTDSDGNREYVYNVSFGFNETMLSHYEEEDEENSNGDIESLDEDISPELQADENGGAED